MDKENLQINNGDRQLEGKRLTGLHNTAGVLDDNEPEPDVRTEFTGKLYRAGRTFLLMVPKICADLEVIKPNDRVRVAIRKEKEETKK